MEGLSESEGFCPLAKLILSPAGRPDGFIAKAMERKIAEACLPKGRLNMHNALLADSHSILKPLQ